MKTSSSPQGSVVPRFVSFEVRHYRGENPPSALGAIGFSTESIRLDDDVRVFARISAPCYCYLIALNPDGAVQLCDPPVADEAPGLTDRIDYPSGEDYFPLTDGTGSQAFILIASREPLPPYRLWRGRDAVRWERSDKDISGVWTFDGRTFEPMNDATRGQPRTRSGVPAPLRNVCQSIAAVPGVDAVRAVAFRVEPSR